MSDERRFDGLVKSTDENNNKTKEKILRQARRRIRALFYWQTLGLVLCLSALLAVQMLQTSINIEGHIGSISVTACFVTSLFVCIFVCPTLLQTLGPRTCLILSEICYLIYCVCNFYPELYVLVPAGIFAGIGRALFVPSYSMLIITLTYHCSKYTTSREEQHYFNQFQSRFYSLNEFVQIIGNGLSYAILYSTYLPHEAHEANINSTNFTNFTNFSTNLYEYCGKNDCQESDVVQQSIYQYVPPKKSSVHIFLSTTVLLALSGIAMHCTIFPGVGPFAHKLSKIERTVTQKLSLIDLEFTEDCSNLTPSRKSSKAPLTKSDKFIDDGNTTDELVNGYDKAKMNGRRGSAGFESGDATPLQKTPTTEDHSKKNLHDGYWTTVKKTLLFMVRPRAILVGVATLHSGMLIGFCFADLTRAYASCVAGVQMTGAFAASFGIAGMVSSYFYGKALPFFGRISIYSFASALELAVYALCFFWIPDPNTIYVVFFIFIGIGLVNGMIRQNLIAAYTIHFPKEKGIALIAFNVAYTGGIGVQYGLSTFMCVSNKIFTQVAVTSVGLLFYGVAELILARKNRRTLSDEGTKISDAI